MAKQKMMPLGTFMRLFSTEEQCQKYLWSLRWKEGFACPCCKSHHGYRLSSGLYQCADCHHQTSATAGTVLHGSHTRLTKWFLAFYLVCMDKRGISATQLASQIGVTYKTAWFMLKRIRIAMGQRDSNYKLSGIIEFDDAYFGGPTVGEKRGRGTRKAKVFVALSLDEQGNPQYLKLQVTPNIKQTSVKKFAQGSFTENSAIHSDGYRSYIPALEGYDHIYKNYDPDSGMLHWLHIMISNAKAFILGTYHGLPQKNLQEYLDEFCYRFSRRSFGPARLERLVAAICSSIQAYSKG